uniref:t-SNARE coiled-coil homology domain-containing protein n=1 Tax=Asterionellopsis glacialis TaxID=33640 RepID=A0A7S0KXP8_9STRA
MLSELTQLVKSKSLFVDDSSKVNMLVVRIKGNIENLNGRLDEAAQVISHQKRRLGRHSQAGQEASNLVGQLQEEFVEATAGFKKVLQERTDTLKDTTDQKRRVYGAEGAQYESGGPDPSLVSLENKPIVYEQQASAAPNLSQSSFGGHAPSSGPLSFPTIDLTSQYGGMSAGESTGSLPRPHGARGEGGGSDYTTPGMRYRRQASEPLPSYSGSASTYASMGGGGNGGEPMTPLDIQRMEQASGQDQTMQLIPDQDYLRERADAMSTVETNIVELGTIFNKLAVMVSEHREMVQRVEDNVDDANSNIMLSMETLTDTLNNLRTNKQLFMKVFSVIVLFIVLFITFFA